MKEHPILFSDEMVRAVLAGRKTQTRRPITRVRRLGQIVAFRPASASSYDWSVQGANSRIWHDVLEAQLLRWLPFGAVGDHLWVKEAWERRFQGLDCLYRADDNSGMRACKGPWGSSIHMPHWASRITLEITRIWIEMLQEIDCVEATAEGMAGCCHENYECSQDEFKLVWDRQYAKRGFGWDANPAVVVREFCVVKHDCAAGNACAPNGFAYWCPKEVKNG